MRTAPTAADYGVRGTGANVTLRRNGVTGGPAFQVKVAGNRSVFAFDAVGNVRAERVGMAYRIGVWLRSSVPGIAVCIRIKEVARDDAVTPVRTTETCLSPSAHWQHFRIVRRTLARGDKLVFSVYSYGALPGDSFEIDGFTVMRKAAHGWKRVDAALPLRPST